MNFEGNNIFSNTGGIIYLNEYNFLNITQTQITEVNTEIGGFIYSGNHNDITLN